MQEFCKIIKAVVQICYDKPKSSPSATNETTIFIQAIARTFLQRKLVFMANEYIITYKGGVGGGGGGRGEEGGWYFPVIIKNQGP